jgi:hypothetical protein
MLSRTPGIPMLVATLGGFAEAATFAQSVVTLSKAGVKSTQMRLLASVGRCAIRLISPSQLSGTAFVGFYA